MEYEEDIESARDDLVHGQELKAAIEFGLQIQQFLDGEIGQRLLRDSEVLRLGLMEALVLVEDDTAKARDIRRRIGVLDHWQDFFSVYIEEGKKAEVEFQEG